MSRNDEQMSMIDEIDRFEKATYERDQAKIRAKLEEEYIGIKERYGIKMDDMPDGLVVIQQTQIWNFEKKRYETHYYRAVVGHHNTVSGPMAHIISAPDQEWPDVPRWQYDNWHECRWIYPESGLMVRKTEEFDHEVKWK